jgi:hypothetical protein
MHSGNRVTRFPAIAMQLRQRSGTPRLTNGCVASLQAMRATVDPKSISTVLKLGQRVS